MRLSTGIKGSFTLPCCVPGCGQVMENLEGPEYPPGWHPTDEGPACPRHKIRVTAEDYAPEELRAQADEEHARLHALAEARKTREERQVESAKRAAQREAQRAALKASLAQQDAEIEAAHQKLLTQREGVLWARLRAKRVLNHLGWKASAQRIQEVVPQEYSKVGAELVQKIVDAALELQKEQSGGKR